MEIFLNLPLMATLAAIAIAQLIKYPIALIFNRPSAKISIVHATGGMPSSHSAAATALITALILQYGFQDPSVAIAVCFGLIVMFDAMGVRRQSGEQGRAFKALLNLVEKEAEKKHDNELQRVLEAFKDKRYIIDDYLGHKPSEVLGGMTTGFLVALLVNYLIIQWS